MKKFLQKKYTVPAITAVVMLALILFVLLDRVGTVTVDVVTGGEYVTAADVAEAADIREGDSMLRVCSRYRSMLLMRDTNDIEKAVMNASTFIENVECRFDGNDLVITVSEAKPLFSALFGNKYLLCSGEGKVLACTDEPDGRYPVCKTETDGFVLGQWIKMDRETLRTVNRVCEAFEAADTDRLIRDRLSGFSIRSLGDIILSTRDGITVNIGRTDTLRDNMFTLHKILSDDQVQGQQGYLDFTLGDSPVFTPSKTDTERQ